MTLQEAMERAMREYPRSTLAMTLDDFKIVAKSRNPGKVSRIVGERFAGRTLVIFGSHDKDTNYLFAQSNDMASDYRIVTEYEVDQVVQFAFGRNSDIESIAKRLSVKQITHVILSVYEVYKLNPTKARDEADEMEVIQDDETAEDCDETERMESEPQSQEETLLEQQTNIPKMELVKDDENPLLGGSGFEEERLSQAHELVAMRKAEEKALDDEDKGLDEELSDDCEEQ